MIPNPDAIDIDQVLLKANGRKFIPVCHISSEKLNRQFVYNISLLREQQEVLAQIESQMKTAHGYTRRQLEERRQALVAKLDEINNYMIETFRYSVNRNFMVVVEDSYLFRPSSEEELAQLNQDYPDQDWEQSVRRDDQGVMILAHMLDGEDINRDFQNYIQAVSIQVNDWKSNAGLHSRVQAGYTAEYPNESSRQSYLRWYGELERSIQENENYLNQNYGISAVDGYTQVLINSRLYVEIKEDEISQLLQGGSAALY